MSACGIVDNLILISNRLWAQPKDLTVVTLILLLFEKSRMAESKTVAVVLLNSTNYSTWKIQCKMALIKEGLWDIVNGTETAPTEGVERQAKFAMRRDKALAMIVLAVEPSLLYLIGSDPTDPVVVWRTLADQFQHKTWANKLELKAKIIFLAVS